MKILKGLFVIISVICIAFSAFFVYSYASGNTGIITKLEQGITLAGYGTGLASGANGTTSTVSMLTNNFGLTTSQAGQVISIAEEMGIDTSDPSEVNALVAKNIGNADEIKSIAERYQSGAISESQAKSMLAGILNV